MCRVQTVCQKSAVRGVQGVCCGCVSLAAYVLKADIYMSGNIKPDGDYAKSV